MSKSLTGFNFVVMLGFLALGMVQMSQQKQLDRLSSSVQMILDMTLKQLSEIDTRSKKV